MREGVDALERRARALREELESRDGMLEAVQTQAKMDVEDARRERDEARREAKAEKTMRMEAAAMALTALEAKARSEAAMEARDEATPREGEARRELEDAEARLKRAEEAVRARGAAPMAAIATGLFVGVCDCSDSSGGPSMCELPSAHIFCINLLT